MAKSPGTYDIRQSPAGLRALLLSEIDRQRSSTVDVANIMYYSRIEAVHAAYRHGDTQTMLRIGDDLGLWPAVDEG